MFFKLIVVFLASTRLFFMRFVIFLVMKGISGDA
jgi:hypothetical protein